MDFFDSLGNVLGQRFNNDLSRIGMGNTQPTNQQVNNNGMTNPNQAPTPATAQYQYVAPQQTQYTAPAMQAVPGMGTATGTGLTFPQAPQGMQPPMQGVPQQGPAVPTQMPATPGATQVPTAQSIMAGPAVPVGSTPAQAQPVSYPSNQAVAPGNYNQYIAGQESGANPAVGYHNPALSSAYGTYGITAPAYQDIQQADPYFANKPITDLTPEDQLRANTVLRDLNQKRLKDQGVEPTESNLRLAHLLGPTGAKRYLETGYLSPEAAKANGGEARLRQIAEARMGSVQPGMQKVGLATGPQNPQAAKEPDYDQRFIAAQNDPAAMGRLSLDESAPEHIRKAANDQYYRQLTDIRNKDQAIQKGNQLLATGNTSDYARALASNKDEGSYLRAYLYHRFGLNDLAKNEQQKLGAGNQWLTAMGPGGERAVINYDGNGLATSGYHENGKALTGDELAKFAASATPLSKVETVADVYYDPTRGQSARFSYQKTPYGGRFVEAGTGRLASPEEQNRLVKMSSAGPLEQQYMAQYLKSGGGAQGKAGGEGYTPNALPAAPGYAGQPTPNTGPVNPANPATTARQTLRETAGPGLVSDAEQATALRQSLRETAGPGSVSDAEQAATSAPSTSAPAVRETVNPNIPNPNAPAQAAPQGSTPVYQQKIGAENAGKRSNAFNEVIDKEYRDEAKKGDVISNNRKTQFQILDRVDPKTGGRMAETISGLYNAANEHPGEQKWSIVRDIVGGKFKPETEVSQRLAQLDISPEAKASLQEYNALNAQIASQTLRETAGPGSVSDAEQAANRARNVDITKAPMLGVYNMMGQSQFNGDIQRYKLDLAASDHNRSTSAAQFDREFRKTQTELANVYRKRAEERLDWINAHGGNANPSAIREGYKRFPVPEYDPSTGWKYLKSMNEH